MNEEEKINKELKELVTKANRRITALEKYSRKYGSFAVKELYDLIDNKKIQGIGTISRRIRKDNFLTQSQKIAIIKATKNFLKNELSTVRGVEKYRKEMMKKAGKYISPAQASNLYTMYRNWKYYQDKYDLPSDFWQDVRNAVIDLDEKTFIETMEDYIMVEKDKSFRRDMMELLQYLKDTSD